MGGRSCRAAAGLLLANITHTYIPTKARSTRPSKELQHPRGVTLSPGFWDVGGFGILEKTLADLRSPMSGV